MKRVFVVLAAVVAAAFAFDLGAQPPEQDRERDSDRPRGEQQDRDRGDRPEGDRREGDRGFGRGGGFGSFRMPPNPVVAAIDADGNGELSEAEIKNASKVLMALDKNGDKKLSGDEIRPQFGPGGPGGPGGPFGDPNQIVTRILEADANKDGKLSEDEMPERMREGFARLDTNSDGFVDRSELEAMARRFREGGPGRPDGERRRDGDRPDRDGDRDSDRPNRDGDQPNRDSDSVSRDDL